VLGYVIRFSFEKSTGDSSLYTIFKNIRFVSNALIMEWICPIYP